MSDSSPRAQSETLGVVLLLGLTIAGTGLIVAYGSTSLDGSKRATELDSAANAMAQLDSKASLVGIGEADAQEVSLGIDGDEETIRRTKSGWMRVEVNLTNGGTVEVMDQPLGAVVYERGETTIAYQGGGVWRGSDAGATMVSPPEVHYRDTTLTLPLVVVDGEDALDGGHLELTKNGSAAPKFPVAADNRRNPLADATVNVTVKSEYYRAWGRFFEQRTGGSVEYDHAAETVTLTLVTPTKAPTISHALAATSSEQLVIAGGGSTASFTDSYNSTDGPYADTEGQNGTISTVGGAKLTGKANVRGDLVTGGGVVKLKSGNSKITGNLSYGGTKSLHKHATVGGWVADNGSIAAIDPVTSMVNSEVSSTAATNDNDDTTAIEGNRLDPDDTTWTLTNGEYYLDELSLNSGEELVVDLGNGSVDLVVDDDIAVSDGKIVVENPANGTANVYMAGDSLEVSNAANVSVADDRSPSFRIYGGAGTDAEFTGGATFTGVFYAPNSNGQQGTISVTSQTEVFGALVGGRTTLQSGGVVHYDQALVRTKTLPNEYTAIPRVTYMHVSVHRVDVESP